MPRDLGFFPMPTNKVKVGERSQFGDKSSSPGNTGERPDLLLILRTAHRSIKI